MVTAEKMPIIQKIKKLLDKAESAATFSTQEEATLFMEKAQEMLVKYELSLSEVEFAMAQEDDPMREHVVYPYDKNGKIKYTRARTGWQIDLAHALARANFCCLLQHTGANCVTFIGRVSHTEVASFIWQTLTGEVERMCEMEYNRAWTRLGADAARGFPAGYRVAFVNTVRKRLHEVVAARKAQMQQAANGVALMRLDTLSTAAEKWQKDNIKTHSVTTPQGRYSGNQHGRIMGRDHGERVSLNANGLRGGNGGGTRQIGNGS